MSPVLQVSDKLDEELLRAVRQLLETVLKYLSQTSQLSDKFSSAPTAKFWRVLLHKCHDLLDCVSFFKFKKKRAEERIKTCKFFLSWGWDGSEVYLDILFSIRIEVFT